MSRDVDADVDVSGYIRELPPTFEGDIKATNAMGTIGGAGIRSSQGAAHSPQDAHGGKINLTGAREQSLRQYFRNNLTRGARPKLSVSAAEGSVWLETLSWAQNITQKFTMARDSAEEDK